jgi:hypothetical protein
MLKHVVVWKLRDPSRKAEHGATVKSALESVRGRIPGLLAIEVGLDAGYESGAADVALYSEFSDRAALDRYQLHPLHVAAKGVVAPLLRDRCVVDWEA